MQRDDGFQFSLFVGDVNAVVNNRAALYRLAFEKGVAGKKPQSEQHVIGGPLDTQLPLLLKILRAVVGDISPSQ